MLRSKSPDLVLQEIWAHLCYHYAIRSLMNDAAHHRGHDPDRVSFTAALRIVRRSIAQVAPPRAFPPDQELPDPAIAAENHWHAFLHRLLARLNPRRRHRSAPRVIKRKMPNWHVKRAVHASWPQPEHAATYAIHAPN